MESLEALLPLGLELLALLLERHAIERHLVPGLGRLRLRPESIEHALEVGLAAVRRIDLDVREEVVLRHLEVAGEGR